MVTEPVGDSADLRDISRIAGRLKERIYAELTIIAVTLGLALSGSATHLSVTLSVVGTSLGLWLATLSAEIQAYRIAQGRMMPGAELRHMLSSTSPLMTAGAGPLVFVGLSALHVLPLTTALHVSVAVGAAAMFLWGCVSGKRMGAGAFAAVVSGVANLLIGGIVIAVKLAAGH
ncbi:hypothetical protein [Nocardiopsis synnemataformans]|uniref:hypothetical protein n=1 Tax=Nocardiopsis synnemataformans TaxID=61305 RepID=UPI003EBCD018